MDISFWKECDIRLGELPYFVINTVFRRKEKQLHSLGDKFIYHALEVSTTI